MIQLTLLAQDAVSLAVQRAPKAFYHRSGLLKLALQPFTATKQGVGLRDRRISVELHVLDRLGHGLSPVKLFLPILLAGM
jgi:hypothetical protein